MVKRSSTGLCGRGDDDGPGPADLGIEIEPRNTRTLMKLMFKDLFWKWYAPFYLVVLPTLPLDLYNSKYFFNQHLVNPKFMIALNFLTLVMLGHFLGKVNEHLEPIVGASVAVAISIILGNAVEALMSVMALFDHKIDLVRTSLVGGVVSNIFMVLPFCLVLYPIGYAKRIDKWRFRDVIRLRGKVTWSTMFTREAGLPATPPLYALLTSIGLIVCLFIPVYAGKIEYGSPIADGARLNLLYAEPVILLCIYIICMIIGYFVKDRLEDEDILSFKANGVQVQVERLQPLEGQSRYQGDHRKKARMQEKKNKWFPVLCVLGLAIFIIWLSSEVLLDNLDKVPMNVPLEFRNFIVVPIAGNLAEHVSSMNYTMKGKFSMAVATAAGSAFQLAAFVLPILALASTAKKFPIPVDMAVLSELEIFSTGSAIGVMILLLLVPFFWFWINSRQWRGWWPKTISIVAWLGLPLLIGGFGGSALCAGIGRGIIRPPTFQIPGH